ncbi:MAG: PQQ-binding-like beta-propeller repeat protein [Actinobacteria bacterium]|nr:PQQ-binding-like beta-propeller repeat protein [Actinomycetota bacterium]
MRLIQAVAGVVAVAFTIAVVTGCGGGGGSGSGGGGSGDVSFQGDAYPGTDLANSRHAEGEIERANVAELAEAWSLPLTAQSSYGAISATPVIAGGVAYVQDLESNVQAVDLADGEVLWSKDYREPDQGPNGVVVGGEAVFGATPTKAFALDRETGEELWSVHLADGSTEAIDMAPGYHEGLVYVSTVPTNVRSEYPSSGVGRLWALDARTGKKVWHFDTVPKSLWGDRKVNAGGGLWYAPAFDGRGGMYFGVGNPVPFPGTEGRPFGASRPGPNLYTDSMVKLDARTGKLEWYYQQTPHDLYDWDFQDPPILASIGGREVAIGAGKSGYVVAVDAGTGKPVWKTAVGRHNGHDEDGLLAMRGESSKIKAGTVYPGLLGGVISPMAANQTTLFVPVVNHPLTLESGAAIGEGAEASGELVALDLATGRVRWKDQVPVPMYGSPAAANDMVFIASPAGTVTGFDAKSGGELWSGSLPAGSNTGLAISGDTLLVPAGLASAEGQKPALVAFRLGG